MNFDFSKLKLEIPLKNFVLILIFSLISIIFNFGAFDQDSTQYIYMALHFINQPPLEFIIIFPHIALLTTYVRLIRPLVPFLAGWLNDFLLLGKIPAFSFYSGYWQLSFGIINGVFSFLSSIILYKLVFYLSQNSEKSIIAVILYNFSNIMFVNSMILIEGGTLFFAILLVYLIICRPFEKSYKNSLLMGITIGLAGLTRETLLITGVFLFLGYSIYRIKELLKLPNFKKFLITGLITIAIYGGYVLILGIRTFLNCLYIFFNLNLTNLLAFFIPQPFISKLPETLQGIGFSMLNVFKYTFIFFILGIINLYFFNKSRDNKILVTLYLIASFFPLLLSPLVVERFLYPFYLVSLYLCIEGIYCVEENKIWVYSIVISISILNLIFVVFFYPYTIGQQLTGIEIRNFLYNIIYIYLIVTMFLLFYKQWKKSIHKNVTKI